MSMESVMGFKESSIGTKVMSQRVFNDDGSVNWKMTDKAREDSPIYFDHDADMISFKMMTKPASEGGKGCQFTDLIEVALHQLKYFNRKFTCDENKLTIYHLEEALSWQKERTANRIKRNVEGKNEA